MTLKTNRKPMRMGLSALSRWWAFIALLTFKNAGERFHLRRSDWAAMLSIAEPLALVFVVGYVRQTLFQSPPPFGTSTIVFDATGLLPYYMFYHTSQKIRGLDSIRNVPTATWAENAFAYVLGEIAIKSFIMAGLFFCLWMNGVPDAIPVNPLGCLPPMIAIAIMGLAVGVFNAMINSIFEIWHYFYTVAVRILMLFSAIFFVMDFVPSGVRNVAVYNPIAQGVSWLRANFYAGYPSATLDVSYVLTSTAILLLLAMMFEVDTRRWRTSR